MCFRVTRFGRVIERVGVLRGLNKFASALQRIAPTVAEEPIVTYELDAMSLVTFLDAVRADRVSGGRIARVAPIEIGHRKRVAAGDFVQTLAGAQRFLNEIIVIENFVVRQNGGLHVVGEPLKSVRENAVSIQGGLCVCDLHTGTSVRMNSIVLQYGVRLGRNEHSALIISKYVIVDQFGLARIENTDATVLGIKNFVFDQLRV